MTTRPHVRLVPPPGFAGLPIEESEEDNARNLRALAARTAGPAGVTPQTMTEHLTLLAAVMATNGVLLYGRFAVSTTDGGRPATASLALTMRALAAEASDAMVRNRGAAAAELLRLYRKRVPHAVARVVDLPIGPAMVATTAGEYRLPAGVRPELKAEFQIVAPDGRHLVVLAVITADEAAWPAVAAAASHVATTLRFEPAEDEQP